MVKITISLILSGYLRKKKKQQPVIFFFFLLYLVLFFKIVYLAALGLSCSM